MLRCCTKDDELFYIVSHARQLQHRTAVGRNSRSQCHEQHAEKEGVCAVAQVVYTRAASQHISKLPGILSASARHCAPRCKISLHCQMPGPPIRHFSCHDAENQAHSQTPFAYVASIADLTPSITPSPSCSHTGRWPVMAPTCGKTVTCADAAAACPCINFMPCWR